MLTVPETTSEVGFVQVWKPVSAHVRLWCARAARGGADADDLYQCVLIRAWRGYPTFRGESSFLTWVMRIAEREASRMAARRRWLRRSEQQFEDEFASSTEPSSSDDSRFGVDWLRRVADQACAAGAMTNAERDVIVYRLSSPDTHWASAAADLGTTPAGCAVTHCRAVPKLRTFLFLQHQHVLGGPEAVEAAFRAAATALEEPLSVAERDVFEQVVIAGRRDYRRRGWQANLRRACGRVVRHLDRDLFAAELIAPTLQGPRPTGVSLPERHHQLV